MWSQGTLLKSAFQSIWTGKSSKKLLDIALRSRNATAGSIDEAVHNREKVLRAREDLVKVVPRVVFHFAGGWIAEAVSMMRSYINKTPMNTPMQRNFQKTRQTAKAKTAQEVKNIVETDDWNATMANSAIQTMSARGTQDSRNGSRDREELLTRPPIRDRSRGR